MLATAGHDAGPGRRRLAGKHAHAAMPAVAAASPPRPQRLTRASNAAGGIVRPSVAYSPKRLIGSVMYQAEIDHLAIARSPAYHYEPETNGCVEKFIQTLKEQVLWIERFDTLEQLRARIRQFARDYNEHWLLERHGYRTPRQARDALRHTAMA
jgi:hypothetical protein